MNKKKMQSILAISTWLLSLAFLAVLFFASEAFHAVMASIDPKFIRPERMQEMGAYIRASGDLIFWMKCLSIVVLVNFVSASIFIALFKSKSLFGKSGGVGVTVPPEPKT